MAFTAQIQVAIRQIKRWLIAAEQDAHPAIKLLHANYAVGDIDMLRQMFTDAEVASVAKEDIIELYKRAINLQDQAQNQLMVLCPGAAPEL